MSRPALEICDISKWFAAPLAASGRLAAIERVSLAVQPGEVVGIVGPPGAGKSTLLRCAAGLLRPDEGTVACAPSPDSADAAVWFRSVAHHPPCISARELLALTPALRRLSVAERAAQVEDALCAFALEARADRPLVHLGPDSAARVALAVALAGAPRLLVIDQDASGQTALSAGARAVLASQVGRGLAVLAAARDRRSLPATPDRVLLLATGRIRAELSVKRVEAADQRRKRSAARARGSSWSVRA